MGFSPYEHGRQVGMSFGAARQEASDQGNIKNILAEAQASGDPQVLQNSIGRILSSVSKENQPAAINYLQNMMTTAQTKQQQQQQFAREKEQGLLPGAAPAVQVQALKNKQEQNALSEFLYGNTVNQQARNEIQQPNSGMQQPQEGNLQSSEAAQPGMSIQPSQNTNPLANKTEGELVLGQGSPSAAVRNLSKAQADLNAEREKKRANESKEISESYKENKPYIDKIYDQYEDSLRKSAIMGRMQELESSGELSQSRVINSLEELGLKQEWLRNPANEEYTKLSLDLLGGGSLQADYGSRILASEFATSIKRIPTLNLTEEGRKQIIANANALLLPKKLQFERMRYYLDKQQRDGKPLPHDLRGKILRDIQPQLEQAAEDFKFRNGRYKVKSGTSPDDNVIEKYYFLSNGDLENAKKMMKEDGYGF
jgi:hypothetical protein